MVTHFERLLSSSNEPLSFIVFMQDPTPRFLKRLEESKWNKRILKVLALEHEYRHGYQHVLLP
jgi:phosphorylated CTD-interacting factor 1